MDSLLLQLLNGLDKGGAYALIALGLTLVFGTLGVVNFAHGALFMLGAFVAVSVNALLNISARVRDESITAFEAYKEQPFLEIWFGDVGAAIMDWSVPIAVLVAIPVMLLIGLAMERGLIRFFYRRSHAEQILVTFGLAIVLGEIVKTTFGANPIPLAAPDAVSGPAPVGAWLGLSENLVLPVVAADLPVVRRADHRRGIRVSCATPPTAWWCVPAWRTGRRWAFSASTSSVGSPSSSGSPRWSPGWPARCTRQSCRRTITSA